MASFIHTSTIPSDLSPALAGPTMEGFKKFNNSKSCKLNRRENWDGVRVGDHVRGAVHSSLHRPSSDIDSSITNAQDGIAAMRGMGTQFLHGHSGDAVMGQFPAAVGALNQSQLSGITDMQLNTLGGHGINTHPSLRSGYHHEPYTTKPRRQLTSSDMMALGYNLTKQANGGPPRPQGDSNYLRYPIDPNTCVANPLYPSYTRKMCNRNKEIHPTYAPPHDRPSCKTAYNPTPTPRPFPHPGGNHIPTARHQYCHGHSRQEAREQGLNFSAVLDEQYHATR